MRTTLAVLLAAGLMTAACGSAGDDAGDGSAREDARGGATEGTAEGGTGDGGSAATCDPARPSDPVTGPQTFESGGETREYLLALPEDYDGTTAAPLVLNFHGFSNNMEGQEAMTGMGEQGASRGYVVVTPDALGQPQEWNAFADEARPDDFAFVDALVDDLAGRLCLDTDRVYAAGHSNGSAFTGFLVCQESSRLAAVAMVAAFVPRTCPVEDPAPEVMAVHGSADPLVPYEGGTVAGSSIGIPPARDTLARFGEEYGCEAPVAEDEPVPGAVERRRFTGCAHGDEVALYTVVGGGHEWPEGPDFSATAAILDFFDRH